ncbi:MAG: helix-turn-helix domain-containing protein [Chitinophagales bacterium]|nr:helix-turn-helix domain-containing protein [Chitinophagales bacterium]
MAEVIKIASITDLHQRLGLVPPKHPLITVFSDQEIQLDKVKENTRFISEMYLILFKEGVSGSIGYGRNSYDFQHGTLIFVAPGQVMTSPTREMIKNNKGWSLLFHPDLIRKDQLGSEIDKYTFFSYEITEALHLSADEQEYITTIITQLKKEYSKYLDQHSQQLIISNLELFLNYCRRFYDRQFYTRSNINQDTVAQFEKLLKDYFNTPNLRQTGLPSVSYFGEKLNISSNYLSDLLKKETGKSTRSHINDILIDKIKTALLSSSASISEIAYSLGFDYPQSLSRLFKSKTGHSPKEYRNMN